MWYGRVDSFLMRLGFIKSKENSTLYYKVEHVDQMVLLLYVDDVFLTGEEKLIHDSKKNISTIFKMKYLGMMHYFLGLDVWQNPDEIVLSQGKYTVEILKRFGMMDCKSMSTSMTMNLKLLGNTTSETINAT